MKNEPERGLALRSKLLPRALGPVWYDLVLQDRIVSTGDVVALLSLAAPGVYDVENPDGSIVAVATVRDDGTWRIEGGKRNGR